ADHHEDQRDPRGDDDVGHRAASARSASATRSSPATREPFTSTPSRGARRSLSAGTAAPPSSTLTTLPDHFDRPAGFDLAAHWTAYTERFEADSYPEHATVRLSPDGLTRAQILLPPAMARAALDTATPPGPDGWIQAVLPIESVRHAHVELLKLGADAEALDPPELRAMITATVRALAARYTPAPAQLG
ncbi:YafY family protein, partial [Actinomadura sp. BRA 177]|uniref:helix-turn-helix transcriptional regulator n=1 Tax=Actinomadura sp. BRA 177 TaxID=2745202 RepID=UPI001595B064